MKIKELREKSDNELKNLVRESVEKLKELRFSLTNKQLKNYKEIGLTKKVVAKAKTILTERMKPDNKKK